MWASNALRIASISSLITGAHQEQAVQVTTLPPGVFFRTISRFIVVTPYGKVCIEASSRMLTHTAPERYVATLLHSIHPA